MSRTLEQVRAMAKRSANSERKPMSILNLNPIAALYVVRDYVQGMESRREFVERVDPDAVEPTPVADEPVAPSHRPILDSDVEAAARGLQMARKSIEQLESLIAHHGKPDALFASHVIAEAARREIERRSPNPEPVLDVRSMSKPELRTIVQRSLDGWNGDDSSLTAEYFAAAGELERRNVEAESAFFARVDAWGGKSAFDYEARDPSDGMTVHAYDLLCDQFFGLDDARGGDYAAAWERATSVLASCTRLDGNRYVIEPIQQVEPESVPACAPPVVERQVEPRCTIETDERTGDLRAFVGERCVAVAWRTLRAGHLRMTHYNVHNVWQGGCGVSAIGRTAAKTTLRRMAHEYITATCATS